jgi:hypothetical protein
VASLGLAAAGTLVVLHAFVLWDRVAQGRLTEPELRSVARRGRADDRTGGPAPAGRVALLWGRRALVFWLLVLVLTPERPCRRRTRTRLSPERLLFVVPARSPACLLALLLVTQLVGGAARPGRVASTRTPAASPPGGRLPSRPRLPSSPA